VTQPPFGLGTPSCRERPERPYAPFQLHNTQLDQKHNNQTIEEKLLRKKIGLAHFTTPSRKLAHSPPKDTPTCPCRRSQQLFTRIHRLHPHRPIAKKTLSPLNTNYYCPLLLQLKLLIVLLSPRDNHCPNLLLHPRLQARTLRTPAIQQLSK